MIPRMEFAKALIKALIKIQLTMNRSKSSDGRRKALCVAVDGLSEIAYVMHVPQIIEIINKKKDVCQEYVDTEAQVKGIIEWLPRIVSHEAMLYEIIKERRLKYNLKG